MVKKVLVDFSFEDIINGFKMQVENEILKREIERVENDYRNCFIKKLNNKKKKGK